MDRRQKLKAEARAAVLKAMAHPTRVYIVDLIERDGPQCVCEITRRIGVDTSTVSRHLSVLKSVGILQDSKQGTTVYYSLACDCISEFMAGLEKVLSAVHRRDVERFQAAVGP